MRRFVCGVAKRPAELAMEGLRRPTKSRQGAKPNSAKPTQVGSSTRRLSCIARQRLPILSHSTPHPQPPHLYKCGGSHAANNEGPRTELHFAAIEPCSAKTSAARSRQPFIPASFAPHETSREERQSYCEREKPTFLWHSMASSNLVGRQQRHHPFDRRSRPSPSAPSRKTATTSLLYLF